MFYNECSYHIHQLLYFLSQCIVRMHFQMQIDTYMVIEYFNILIIPIILSEIYKPYILIHNRGQNPHIKSSSFVKIPMINFAGSNVVKCYF